MIDYEYKAQVLKSGLPSLQKRVSKALFFNCDQYNITLQEAEQIDDKMRTQNPKMWHECEKINHAYFHRAKRLRNRIMYMLANDNCLFLTLTFSDDTLNSTSAETRRRYVSRYLNSYNTKYVANIDFGGKKGREHYHAVIMTDKIDYQNWHKYGAIKGKKIYTSIDSGVKLAKYVSKLTNHAIKETTKRQAMLYSRG